MSLQLLETFLSSTSWKTYTTTCMSHRCQGTSQGHRRVHV